MAVFLNELRRVYSLKRVLIMLCLLFVSCVLYFNEQGGNVLYRQYSEVIENQSYNEIDLAAAGSGVSMMIQDREDYVNEYADSVNQVIARAKENMKIGIFAKKGSFSYNNQLRVIRDFSKLQGVQPEFINDSAVRTFFSYEYNVFFMLGAMLVIVASMDLGNKKSLGTIVYATPRGRYVLGIARVAVIMLSALTVSMVFIAVHLAEGFGIYGGADIIDKPLQSIPEFSQFRYCISVGGGIVLNGIYTACGLALTGLFMLLLLWVFRNPVICVIVGAAAFGIEYIFFNVGFQSAILLFKYMNILALIMSGSWFSNYVNVSFFGNAVPAESIAVVFAAVMLILLGALCVYMSGRRVIGRETWLSKLVDRVEYGYNALISHIFAGAIPIYTFLVGHRGILVIFLVVFLVADNSRTTTAQYSTVTKIKCEMYEEISALDDDGKMAYLQKIIDEYTELSNMLNETGERLASGEATFEEYCVAMMSVAAMSDKAQAAGDIQNQVNSLKALYEGRKIRGTLVNEAAYEHLIGEPAARTEELNIVCIYLCVVIFAASLFAYDDEKNMRAIIISTPKGRTDYYIKKFVLLFCINLIIVFTEGFIFVENIIKVYGLKNADAWVQSLSWLSGYPFKMKIVTYIVMIFVYRLIFCAAITLIVGGAAVMAGRFIGIVSGIAGLMPYLILRLGVRAVEPFSVIRYMQFSGFQSGVPQSVVSIAVLVVLLAVGVVMTFLGIRNWRKLL